MQSAPITAPKIILTPAKGIYPDISNDDYHNGPGISRSAVMEFSRSPAHYWNRYLNPEREPYKETSAKILGAMLHTYLLEPGLFDQQYAIEIQFPTIEKALLLKDVGRDAFDADKIRFADEMKWKKDLEAQFYTESAGKRIIAQKEYDIVRRMGDSILSIPHARNIIENGLREQSIYWEDQSSGVLMKARPDIIGRSNLFLADVKTTKDASKEAFERSVYEFGYHVQAAFGIDGTMACTGSAPDEFIILAVENIPPYFAAIRILDLAAIERGREKYMAYLPDIKKCQLENVWPGYQTEIVSIPYWAFNKDI